MSESASSNVAASLGSFATAVADKVTATGERAYSYHTVGSGADSIPDVNPVAGSAFTDCSGWVSFALDSVAPLHQAVAAAHRTESQFNKGKVTAADGGTVDLAEATDWGWARADVLTDLFKNADGANGFTSVPNFANLQAGDVIAYALGLYADPTGDTKTNPGLVATLDTGHTMIVTDAPALVTDAQLLAEHANLSTDVVAVYSVSVVDSSDLHHFTSPEADDRDYTVPADDPRTGINGDKGGGLGTGTMWFGVNAAGQAVQFCFGAKDSWQPPDAGEASVIAAARLTETIDLGATDLQDGKLIVRVYPNASPVLDGVNYAVSERLVGAGGLKVTGGGTLALGAGNSFQGAVEVGQGTTLAIGTDDALGATDNPLTLDDGARLRVGAALTLAHAVAVAAGTATLDLAGNAVSLTGSLSVAAGATLELASGTAGGTLQLGNAVQATGTIQVDGGAALTLTGTGAPDTIALTSGATLNVGATSSLSHLLVSGTTNLSVSAGATLTVTGGASSVSGVGMGAVQVSGGGSLVVMAGSAKVATLSSGATLYTGTLDQFANQTLAAFKAGDVIDVTGLVATTGQAGGQAGVINGVTAKYDNATGLLTIAEGTATATVRLAPGLKLGPDGTTAEAFTIRTDGTGGTLVQLTAATGQGASDALGASAARTAYGVDGSGVTVGVISISNNTLGGLAQDIANGDLPADTEVLNDPSGISTDEGRAMAQLIHTIAPGASIKLYSATGLDNGQDIATAIDQLVANHARVIVDDMSVEDDRMYQEGGPVAEAIARAKAAGVVLVTSAGDSGINYYEHALSLQPTSLPDTSGTVQAFDFGQGTNPYLEEMDLKPTGQGNVELTLGWTQPGDNPAYKLNIAIFTKNTDGSYTKTKDIPYAKATGNGATVSIPIANSANGGTFYVAVYSTAPVALSDQMFKLTVHHEGYSHVFSDPNADQGSGSIYGHALDPNEITAGAVYYQTAEKAGSSASTPEPFSTSGTGAYLLDAAGNRENVMLSKPDVSGVDGVHDDVSGVDQSFYGTSASAPTVAAVAAMLLQANPHLTPDQVKDMLETSATPTTNSLQGGAGLVQADKAVALASLSNGGTATVDYTGKTIVVGAGGTVTTGAGGNTINVTDTGTVLSHGPDTVNGGTGATTVSTLGSGGTVVGGAGALTVAGGSGSNTVFAGAGGLTYQGGSGFDTVVGLGQAMTVTGGTGGGQFFGGGTATITAGAGGDLNVVVGGNGDQLYAAGPKGVLFGSSGGDVLMSSAADTGTSVFFGAGGTGHMTFITGAGDDMLALGQGRNDVTLGSGHAVIFGNGGTTAVSAITAGSGSLDLAFSGASTVLTIAAGAARAFNLYAYSQGQESIHLQGFGADEVANAITTQRSLGGGTQLSLSDGSVISLVGVDHATASLFS